MDASIFEYIIKIMNSIKFHQKPKKHVFHMFIHDF